MLELMKAHPEFAAWVQAIGAIAAILAAFIVTHMQARHAQRHEDRRTAEQVRSLARLVRYLRNVSNKTSAIREHGGETTKQSLQSNYDEFNYIASEVDKFGLVDAPSEVVMRAMMRYRRFGAILANDANPERNPLLNDVTEAIAELKEQADILMVEADRLESQPAMRFHAIYASP